MANEPVRDSVHMYATLRTERWKYLARRGELFDLEQDPGERHNLAAEKSGLVAELDRRLQELIGNDQQRREEFQEAISEAPAPVELTAEEVDQLRALGYLQ